MAWANVAAVLVLVVCAPAFADTITVDTAPAHRIASFRPLSALGSTVDKEPAGTIPQLYSQRNVRAMLDAGWGWLSYRLFTELSVQDWHWNPVGNFSAGSGGYWTSSASVSRAPIADSFGYRLPHRGFTTDQGNNEDYSRLDDGDPHTYWKSDPYLSSSFTGEPDALHPQWVVVDLESPRPVNAVKIAWSSPYATSYAIAYWIGSDPIGDPGHGRWALFPGGTVRQGNGGVSLFHISSVPIWARFVRVEMAESSNTCDSHGASDPRDCVGYAINELFIGRLDARGRFRDYVHHAPCGGLNPGRYACGLRQTATYVSSVDPWHSPVNRVRNQEQPGLDLIARSGLTRDIGATYPVPMLYSTPQNAVNEIAYLKARGYKIERVELGEETDGQYTTPEDYGALYVQWARALHRYDPHLKLGGPVFQGVNTDVPTWPDSSGNVSWFNRFLQYLQRRGAMSELSFMSFEHYPFPGCEHGAKLLADLVAEPGLMKNIASVWRKDGLPSTVPMYVTEANFSATNFTQTPMQIEGALWQADYMASALTSGVSGVVYYQYEPVPLSHNMQCPSDWGNLTMFDADANAKILARTAQYYAGRMLTREWVAPGNREHDLYKATVSGSGRKGLVTAYVVKRPDGLWSIMTVNKDSRPHSIAIHFGRKRFAGTVTRTTFGSAQYVWRSKGAQSRPDPNDPPATTTMRASDAGVYVIPAQSITVLRGRISAGSGR